MKKNQTIIVKIDKIELNGKGVARFDDFVVFIKGVIPGQKVEAVITKLKKNYAEAKKIKILECTQFEIEPKCSHFGICGGCVWQNLSYLNQLEYKHNIVIENIEHIARIKLNKNENEFRENTIFKIRPSPKEYEYRNKVEFSFGYESMNIIKNVDLSVSYDDKNPSLGFHKPKKWQEVVDIKHCYLISKNANRIYKLIKEWCLSNDKLVYNPKNHKGFFRNLLLRENVRGEVLINIIVNEDIIEDFFQDLIQQIKKKKLVLKSLYFTINKGLNDDWASYSTPILIYGDTVIYEDILGMKFKISPQSFFQTNTMAAEILYTQILEYAKNMKVGRVLDLYCGTGVIGLILASKLAGASVVGIDTVNSSIQDAYINAKLNKINNVEYLLGKVEKILIDCFFKYKNSFDLIITDPPRSGMHKNVLKFIINSSVKNIIYVSCNLSTFSRDLKELCSNGYKLMSVTPVDMFPQTAHIELVASIRKD